MGVVATTRYGVDVDGVVATTRCGVGTPVGDGA